MARKVHPLRQLDELDEELELRSGYTNTSRWMIPYADFLTLLLGFFVVMFAMVQRPPELHPEDSATKPQPAKSLPTPVVLNPNHPKSAMVQSAPDAMLMVETPKAATHTQQQLQAALKQQLEGNNNKIHVGQDHRGVYISFQDRLFFEPGSATISPGAQQTLHKLAQALAKTNRPIRVEGHTDNTPVHTALYPSNWELSTARAMSIVKYLITQQNFPPQRLSAAGYGQYAPLANNSTIEGKQKNRRVDIVLLDPLPE